MIYKNFQDLKNDLPNKGRMIGLDVGSKTIGVAICDDSWMIASPKTTILRKSNKDDFAQIKQIIAENKIVAIAIGLPLTMNALESDMSKFVRRFTENLDEFLDDGKIIFIDERLTSFEAAEVMREAGTKKNRKKAVIDQIAASLILQDLINNL